MSVAIFAKDVRPGDVIQIEYNIPPSEVRLVKEQQDLNKRMSIFGKKFSGVKQHIQIHPGSIVILLHRPWPEGQMAFDMLWRVIAGARKLEEAERNLQPEAPSLALLREALETYELGKPLTDDSQNEWIRKYVHQAP